MTTVYHAVSQTDGPAMTLTDLPSSDFADPAPKPVVAEVDGIPVSGLLAEVAAPRAVLVALHGGATSAAYFDCPGHPELSLLRMARRLGFSVLALDRPGYGSSGPFADELAPPHRRVDLMFGAIERHLGTRPRGVGVFLLAHSAGCELALRMAADPRGADLLGVELAGTGRLHPPLAQEVLWGGQDEPGWVPRGVGALLWHPPRLYAPEILGGATIGAVGPRLEADTVRDWATDEFPDLAGRVRIPVRYCVGDHERIWRNDPEELAAVGALFTAAPRVVLKLQTDTGHNISVGRTATAYHLGLLAFAEECAIAAEADDFTAPALRFDGFGA